MSSEDSDRGVADLGLCVPRPLRSCRVDDSVDVVEAGAGGGAPLVLRLAGGEGGMVQIQFDQKLFKLVVWYVEAVRWWRWSVGRPRVSDSGTVPLSAKCRACREALRVVEEVD